MYQLQPKDMKTLIDCAMGKVKADLALCDVNVVNVITGEVLAGTIYVKDGYIAHIDYVGEENPIEGAKKVISGEGQYVLPGLIDAHVHIESSMMIPQNFAKVIIPWGTTTILHDPHEIGNVLGIKGVRFMHDAGEDLPMRQLLSIPSCVPSVPGLETAGADFTAKEITELAELERSAGLAEIMDYLAVIGAEDRMMAILDAAKEKNLYLQAHAPFVTGRHLSAYALNGIKGDHESRAAKEATEKVRLGMYVDIRDSSLSRNVTQCLEGIKTFRYLDHICLCTDDRESEDLLTKGHINDVINVAIEEGMHPMDAIRSATYNTAREMGIERLGALAPGYVADMILVKDLTHIAPTKVFFEGKLVAENGQLLEKIAVKEDPILSENTMHLPQLTVEDFVIEAPIENGQVTVNVMTYENLEAVGTRLEQETVEVKDGRIVLPDDDLRFVAVINRHGKVSDRALHLVRNSGIRHGANASTVSHDSHNFCVVYDTPENAYLAMQELKKTGGGLTGVSKGKVLGTLELPVAGLMSTLPAEELAKKANDMKKVMEELGFTESENPLLRIATLALPVIPEVKMSDQGLIDVNTKTFIPLFA